jgi:hypothetical protein
MSPFPTTATTAAARRVTGRRRNAGPAAAALSLLAAVACAPDRGPSTEADMAGETVFSADAGPGWRPLFDGRTTAGWRGFRMDTVPSGWQVVDGALVRVAAAGDLITVERFRNFELALEWRVEPGGNSGIFFRVTEELDHVWESGPEFQVLDDERHADGMLPETSAGSNYALHAPLHHVVRPAGEWNAARILVDGDRVEHGLNGERVVAYRLFSEDWEGRVAASKFRTMPRYGRVPVGHIALQDHGDRVEYRDIRIRVLPDD